MSAVIHAKFDYSGIANVSMPDPTGSETLIADNFVVSRNKDGSTLSVYGDDVWDLLPYSRVSLSGAKIYFSGWVPVNNTDTKLAAKITQQLKQIIFSEIYLSNEVFSVQSLRSRFTIWCKLARNLLLQGHCFKNGGDEQHLPMLRDELSARPVFAQSLLPRLRFAKNTMPNDVADFSLLSDHAYDAIHRAATQSTKLYIREKSTQTTVIPSRIYSALIISSNEYIDDFHRHAENLFKFLQRCNQNRTYGRNHNRQIIAIKEMLNNGTYANPEKIPRDSRGFCWWKKFTGFEPVFHEASQAFNLSNYFSKYGIEGFNDIKKLLTDLQRAVFINIGIFTGARESEIACLPVDCLSTITLDGEEHVLISGYSSKMQQQITDSEWVADTSTKTAVDAAKKLVKFVTQCNNLKIKDSETPLFIKVTGINCLHGEQANLMDRKPNTSIYSTPVSYSAKAVNELLKRFHQRFAISESDINEVIDIDPHYGYSQDDKFSVGKLWPLSEHQMRRSLVVYAFSEGVAHPDLKWQLKHISLSMTLWYGRNGAFAKAITQASNHIYKDYQDAIAEYEAAQYLANVISEEVKLHGTHGVFISNLIVKHGHNETRRLVARGELAYKETPIGGCVSTSGCSMDAFLNITSCIPCKSAVFTTNDIPKIDRAISHIKNISETSEAQSQAKISANLQLVELNRLKSKVANNG
jgi:hypothetical protein